MGETTLHSSRPYHTTESAQNYLEAILMLSEQKPVVRSVDVANEPWLQEIQYQHCDEKPP